MQRTTKIIILVAIPVFIAIMLVSGWLGERSVTSLNTYGPYSKVDSWYEQDGKHQNLAEIYVCNGTMDIESLQKLCSKKKKVYENGTYSSYTLVVFENKESVMRSSYPITALYGDELEKQRHILAFYSYVPGNEYSVLSYYEKNAADSMENTIRVQ
jgi:hypothetical protein